MNVYPVNFLLGGKPCTVVGGGEVAARKVRGLLKAGAVVTVVCPEACPEIKELANEGKLKWVESAWSAEFAPENTLIMIATNDEEANRRAASDARAAGVPVNVADVPHECDFILPSVLFRGPITVAVGTGGTSPALAANLSRRLSEVVGEEYALAADILGGLRKILEKAGVDSAQRRKIFKELVRSDLMEKLKSKDRDGTETLLKDVVGKYIDASELLGE